LNRKFAVKVPRQDLAQDTAFVDRFLREARAMARVNHPHVIDIFEWGTSPSGQYVGPFFVMEYIDGGSLAD
jgi:serine/threonine protein kinase